MTFPLPPSDFILQVFMSHPLLVWMASSILLSHLPSLARTGKNTFKKSCLEARSPAAYHKSQEWPAVLYIWFLYRNSGSLNSSFLFWNVSAILHREEKGLSIFVLLIWYRLYNSTLKHTRWCFESNLIVIRHSLHPKRAWRLERTILQEELFTPFHKKPVHFFWGVGGGKLALCSSESDACLKPPVLAEWKKGHG